MRPQLQFYVSGDGEIVETAVRVVRESQSYGDDTAEFEFETLPLREENFFHFPTTTKSLAAVADRDSSKNILYSGGWMLDQSLSSPSQSHSSSESSDSEDLSREDTTVSGARSDLRRELIAPRVKLERTETVPYQGSFKEKPQRRCCFDHERA
ncbi:hypothetical protein Bca52824_056483 [Brassica carinata]|uniref:Uncharacterized protein n=1 Tax=Brassica carinata TaxID=52824 RepID=A0A8X7QQK1_BRACI|nr:hypothetical protein Bca52824_056483 [Brassica carinata]